jgi:glutamate N-acetyltransferase/amino-acid N-acetyltransferase
MLHLSEGSLTSPAGFEAAGVACGLKESGRPDLALLFSDTGCATAGLFTQSQVAAAPVQLDRETLARNRATIRGVVANAGNANACTGPAGLAAARQMQRQAAEALGCRPDQILVLSTGVIGVPLPVDKVARGITAAAAELSPEGGAAFAQAIMTTDTRPKRLAIQVELPGGAVTIGGVAKGAGMIHPNMATMLAVITSDARIAPERLPALLRAAADQSFNRISVDGDSSTNDTLLLLANGASGVAVEDGPATAAFAAGLNELCATLAREIVLDGEGASRFVAIRVGGAATPAAAHAVANTIATSPLVKTALAGGDPNWGRILAAAGRAGVALDPECLALHVANPGRPPLQLVAGGAAVAYAESEAAAIFAGSEIDIHLDLGQGRAETTVWTCDLTHDYVAINADYRT